MSQSREREIDMVRAAIRAEAPYDYRRETRWQYDNRLAAAARDALANEPADPSLAERQEAARALRDLGREIEDKDHENGDKK